MERLEQIKVIANNLKTSSTKAIRALHRLVFEKEGDRGNRKRLREFGGFTFASGSEEYKNKLAYAEAALGWGDLVAICNVLAVDYAGTKRELQQRICDYLMDLDSLSNANDDRRDAEEDAVEDDDDEAHDDNDDEAHDDNDDEAHDDDNNEAHGEDDAEETNEDEDDNRTNSDHEDDRRAKKTEKTTMKNKFAMTFRDVEDSIRSFNGDDKYSVARWISDYEEVAELFGWTDIQKTVFAKRSLK
ncbi:protein DEK-like, partial [Pseudomyrmex gracilis]|uniref:protein DEK-like n=1 Tax=Pseudomyrmex gracilis TaxID=219809 RepID=UPI0009949564